MSYILEALRRAETERERKRRVPGLHAQPVPSSSLDERGTRRSNKIWLWIALGVSAGVLLPLLWRWWVIDPIAAEAAAAARAPSAGSVTPQASVDAPPPTAASAPIATAQAIEPPAPAQETPHPPRAAHTPTKTAAVAPKPNPVAGERAPAATGAQPTAHLPRPAASAPQAVAAATATASAPEPRLRSLNEMPEDVRRSVPTLSFGGSVYSETAAQRMVIFNGQVLREGDAVADDVTLEQIRPHSAVMRARGQRFEIAF
jgi:general secretion pathway protein B